MISARLEGIDVVLSGLRRLPTEAKAAAFVGVVQGLKALKIGSEKMISADDHSLAMLRQMGYPYATRDPRPPHTDPVIHAQTGKYRAALTVTPPVGFASDIVGGRISIEGDEQMKALDRWLQEGTPAMIARPWMEKIIADLGPAIAAKLRKDISEAIARAFGQTG